MKVEKRVTPNVVALEFLKKNIDPPWIYQKFINKEIGRGVFTTTNIKSGNFICEYAGELISKAEGEKREKECFSVYRFFFDNYCIDASKESGRLGRLINHADSKKEQNANVRRIPNTTSLGIFAVKDIAEDQEIRYDYGVKVPWLKVVSRRTLSVVKKKKKMLKNPTYVTSHCEGTHVPRTKTKLRKEKQVFPRRTLSLVKKIFKNPTPVEIEEISGYDESSDKNPTPVQMEEISGYDVSSDKNPTPVQMEEISGYDESSDKNPTPVQMEEISGYDESSDKNPTPVEIEEISGYDESSDKYPTPVQMEEISGYDESSDKNPTPVQMEEISGYDESSDKNPTPVEIEEISGYDESSDKNPTPVQMEEISGYDESSDKNPTPVQMEEISGYDESSDKNPTPVQMEEISGYDESSDKFLDQRSMESSEEVTKTFLVNPSTGEVEEVDISELTDTQPVTLPKRQTNYPKVTIDAYIGRPDGRRKYDKTHLCFLCEKTIKTKMERHFQIMHSGHLAIGRLLKLKDDVPKSKKSKKLLASQRKAYADELAFYRNRGAFDHNISVLKSKEGVLLVSRRPSAECDKIAEDYLPCTKCLAFIAAGELWRHGKKCLATGGKLLEEKVKLTEVAFRTNSSLMLEGALGDDDFKDVKAQVTAFMRNDKIGKVVLSDSLILTVGTILLRKLGKAKKNEIAQRLRQLGRLLLELNSKETTRKPLIEFITGDKFDLVVEATKTLCVPDGETANGVMKFKSPSLSIHLGHSLKKCGSIKKGIGLRSKTSCIVEEADAFLQLINAEWNDSVTALAYQSLKERKLTKVELIPLTEDLKKLCRHIDAELNKVMEDITREPSKTCWSRLCELTFSSLLLFNKRRGGELSKMHVNSYKNRPDWSTHFNQDLIGGCSTVEKKLLKSLDMIHISGKRARKVPILIKPKLAKAMKMLADSREMCKVTGNFFFGIPEHPNSFISQWKVIQKLSHEAQCTKPKAITSTRLRKYIATVAQIFDLKEGELEWLSNHLGHSLNVHKDSYRLNESVIEMSKVAKLLMIVDHGKSANYQGLSLKDIDIDDIEITDDILEDADIDTQDERQNDEGDDEVTDENYQDDLEQDEFDVQISGIESEPVPIMKKDVTHIKRQWSEIEINAVKEVFSSFINDKKIPKKEDVLKAIEKYPILKDRTIDKIKSKVQHLIRKT